jgi:hypothetical protein
MGVLESSQTNVRTSKPCFYVIRILLAGNGALGHFYIYKG